MTLGSLSQSFRKIRFSNVIIALLASNLICLKGFAATILIQTVEDLYNQDILVQGTIDPTPYGLQMFANYTMNYSASFQIQDPGNLYIIVLNSPAYHLTMQAYSAWHHHQMTLTQGFNYPPGPHPYQHAVLNPQGVIYPAVAQYQHPQVPYYSEAPPHANQPAPSSFAAIHSPPSSPLSQQLHNLQDSTASPPTTTAPSAPPQADERSSPSDSQIPSSEASDTSNKPDQVTSESEVSQESGKVPEPEKLEDNSVPHLVVNESPPSPEFTGEGGLSPESPGSSQSPEASQNEHIAEGSTSEESSALSTVTEAPASEPLVTDQQKPATEPEHAIPTDSQTSADHFDGQSYANALKSSQKSTATAAKPSPGQIPLSSHPIQSETKAVKDPRIGRNIVRPQKNSPRNPGDSSNLNTAPPSGLIATGITFEDPAPDISLPEHLNTAPENPPPAETDTEEKESPAEKPEGSSKTSPPSDLVAVAASSEDTATDHTLPDNLNTVSETPPPAETGTEKKESPAEKPEGSSNTNPSSPADTEKAAQLRFRGPPAGTRKPPDGTEQPLPSPTESAATAILMTQIHYAPVCDPANPDPWWKKLAKWGRSGFSQARDKAAGLVKKAIKLPQKGLKHLADNFRSLIKKPPVRGQPGNRKSRIKRPNSKRASAAPSTRTILVLAAVATAITISVYWYISGEKNPKHLSKPVKRKRAPLGNNDNILTPEIAQMCPETIQNIHLRQACREFALSGNVQAARIMADFALSGWKKHHFPASTIYLPDQPLDNITTPDTLPGSGGCPFYQYGMIGHIADEDSESPSTPGYSMDDSGFASVVYHVIAGLLEQASTHLESGTDSSTEVISRALLWCGIPFTEAAASVYKGCIAMVAHEMTKLGPDWHTKSMHAHFFHSLSHKESSGKHLYFAPVFPLDRQCSLKSVVYQPRVIEPRELPLPALNSPFQTPGFVNAYLPTDELPEQFNLRAYTPKGNWVDQQTFEKKPSVLNLNTGKIYGIQAIGENTPGHIIGFHQDSLVRATLTTALNSTQAPLKHFWHYEHIPTENSGAKRIETGFLQYSINAKNSGIFMGSALVVTQAVLSLSRKLKGDAAFQEGDQRAPFGYFISWLMLNYVYSSFVDTPVPYSDPKNDDIRRHSGLNSLLKHYVNEQNMIKLNMLAELMNLPDTPLGVFSYNKVDTSLYAYQYESLSYLSLDEQVALFNQAIENCAHHFGQHCNPFNSEQQNFVRFSLAVCSNSNLQQCHKLWADRESRHFWSLMTQELDWPESYMTLGSYYLKNHSFFYNRPAIYRVDQKRYRLGYDFKNRRFGFAASTTTISVDGHYECDAINNQNLACFFDQTTNTTTIYSNESSAELILLKNADEPGVFHSVTVDNQRIITPNTNRHAVWHNDHHVRKKNCSEITHDNLRDTCVYFANEPLKRYLAFSLDAMIKETSWVATFKPVFESFDSTRFHFSGKTHFSELPVERLILHIEIMAKAFDQLRRNNQLQQLMDVLTMTGLINFNNSPEQQHPDFDHLKRNIYKHRYKSIIPQLITSRKPESPLCQLRTLQRPLWCGSDETNCILLMPGWYINIDRFGNVTGYEDMPEPILIKEGKIHPMPEACETCSVVDYTIPPQLLTGYFYEYKSKWTEAKDITPVGEGSSQLSFPKSDRAYLISPDEVSESGSYILMFRTDTQLHYDICGFPDLEVEMEVEVDVNVNVNNRPY